MLTRNPLQVGEMPDFNPGITLRHYVVSFLFVRLTLSIYGACMYGEIVEGVGTCSECWPSCSSSSTHLGTPLRNYTPY